MAENFKIGKLQKGASGRNLKIRKCENVQVAEKSEKMTIKTMHVTKKSENLKTRKCSSGRIREI